MAATLFPRTIVRTSPYVLPSSSEPAVSTDWTVLGTWLAERPSAGDWFMACSVTAAVDPGIEGSLRLVGSTNEVATPVARIVSHVGPILLGWTELQWDVSDTPQFIRLEGRRLTGGGGGVRVLNRPAVTLMALPDASQIPGPTYPPGYDPGQDAPYPPDYSTDLPYGG